MRIFLALCFLLVGTGLAQEPTYKLEWAIQGLQPPTNNIFFLVDTSGSMDGQKVQTAIQMTMQIAETPVDDLQVAIVSFSEAYSRWPGTEDIDPRSNKPLSRKGWSLMPSRDNLDKAFEWLQNNKFSSGTYLAPALKHAFQTTNGENGNVKVKELSIIVISDCGFYAQRGLELPYAEIRKIIIGEQKAREALGLPPASIGFFGIGVDTWMDLKVKRLVGKKNIIKLPELGKFRKRIEWEADLCVLGYCTLKYD